jgi:dUTP pyrophosphatase
MDKLSVAIAAARKMGMSYGEYMVYLSKKNEEPEEQEPVVEPVPEPDLEEKKYCVICGKEIPKRSHRKKYCSKYCYDKKIREEAKANARKESGISSEDVLICPNCGKTFVRGDRHGGMKYCSRECSEARWKNTRKKKKEKPMKVQLDPGAKMPVRAHLYDAGLDLFAKENMEEVVIPPNGSVTIDTGVHLQIPQHFVGLVKSKSGLMVNHKILTDGTVDADYTGSIRVTLFNNGQENYTVKPGQKVAQLVVTPCCLPPLELTDSLEPTARGNNGFGSTGEF